jgi:ribosomal-protein-alanine N-acetyltransferase
VIRDASPADRPAVRGLQALLEDPAPSLLTAAFEVERPGAGGDVLVADDGGVVGYALVVPGKVDASPSVAYLAELAVAPGARRGGHASRLVEAVVERYGAYDQLRVTVAADDAAARAFYASVGFEEREELPSRFEGTDGLSLVRELS